VTEVSSPVSPTSTHFALPGQHARTATVTAEDDLACYLIPAWEFRALLQEHPAMAIPMLHKVIARLHGR
jgi:CRP-like cAMP-binding protein